MTDKHLFSVYNGETTVMVEAEGVIEAIDTAKALYGIQFRKALEVRAIARMAGTDDDTR